MDIKRGLQIEKNSSAEWIYPFQTNNSGHSRSSGFLSFTLNSNYSHCSLHGWYQICLVECAAIPYSAEVGVYPTQVFFSRKNFKTCIKLKPSFGNKPEPDWCAKIIRSDDINMSPILFLFLRLAKSGKV